MILLKKENRNQVLTFIPLIKDNYAEWHIINLKFEAKDKDEATTIVDNFVECYQDKNGFCYMEGLTSAMCVIRLGEVNNYSDIQNEIENKLDDKRCRVLAKKMSSNGLKQIQINLSDSGSRSNNLLFKAREARDENVVMIIDDDMFIRKTLGKLLDKYATCQGLSTCTGLIEEYKEANPDVVILDIHMPDGNGIEILKEINDVDNNAFVIMSSSDSVKENVLSAVQNGALGFLAKPVEKEKLMKYLEQCITFKV